MNDSQAFTVGRKNNDPFFSLNGPLPGPQRHVCTNSKTWPRRTNNKSYLTSKIKLAPKASNDDAKPWFLHSTVQKSKCPRRFWEIDPEILHTGWMCPCRAFHVFFSSFFFAGHVESTFKPKSPKNLKTQIPGGKKNVKGSAGGHSTPVENGRVYL